MPTPAPLQLALHAPGAVRDGLLGAAGEVRVGALEAGARWEFSIDGGKTWHAGSGSALNPSALGADGNKSLLAVQINDRGGRSPAAELKFDMDTIAPAGPGLALATDSGASSSDGWTNDGTVRVDGLEAGARWQYSVDGGATWWNGVGATIASAQLGADGVKDVRVRQTDQAGNDGPVSGLQVLLDTRATDVKLALVDDTGLSKTDGVTRNAAVKVIGLEPGLRWEYRIDGGPWVTGAGDLIAASEFGSNQGERRVEVRHVDGAGNRGGTELGFTLDTRGSMPAVTLAVDSGVAGDGRTNDPTVIVGGLERDAIWNYQINGGEWTRGQGDRIAPSAFDGAADGLQNVRVQQIDAAGNEAVNGLSFQLQRQAATISAALVSDSGAGGDRITNHAAIVVNGLDAGRGWEYRIGNGAWKTGRGGGIAATEFGLDGSYTVDVRQADVAGNVGQASLSFTLDRVAVAPTVALVDDTGPSATDGITSKAAVGISGLEIGASWQFSRDQLTWRTGSGTEIPASEFSGDGAKVVWVRQVDAAGNTSSAQDLRFTVDTVVAAPTLQTATPFSAYYALRPGDATSDVGQFRLAGALNADGRIELGLESGSRWYYSVNGGQDWQEGSGSSFKASTLTRDGRHELRVRQIDKAGNVSGDQSLSFDYDTSAPTVSARLKKGGALEVTTSEAVQFVLQAKGGHPIDPGHFDQSDVWGTERLLATAGTFGIAAEALGVRDFGDDGNAAKFTYRQVFSLYAVDQAGNAAGVPVKVDGLLDPMSWISLRSPTGNNDWVWAMPRVQKGTSAADVLLAGRDDFNVLSGGAGADTFRWDAAQPKTSRTDLVLDYNFAEGDVLDLSAVVASIRGTSGAGFRYSKDVEANGDLLLTVSGGPAAEVLTLNLTPLGGSTSIRVSWDGSTFAI